MRRWFARLAIHRKLFVVSLLVTTVALVLATLSLAVVDLVRYRATATGDTGSLAEVLAENSAAAVAFNDPGAARTTLATVRRRPTVQRACLYLPDGSLFAGFERSPQFACPPAMPREVTWRVVAGSAPVRRNDRVLATVYVERDLQELGTRMAIAGITGLGMVVLVGSVTLALANRLHRTVTRPITQLASVARSIQPDAREVALPDITASDDEVGDLVRAFTDMLRRLHDGNARLVESNQMLRRQRADREQLLAREREANRLKDEFLAAVSHELRTPLNAITGWVQVLATTNPQAATTAKAIESIARNARAQARVIEDLMDVSRIATGKLNIRFDVVDLREVAESAVEAARAPARAKRIALALRAPDDVCFVNGDRDRLQQIVGNLLSNAIKFTPQGGMVSVALTHASGSYELTVTDTGIGIPASFLPHVFDRFRQADGSSTREYSGLGLGLSIVKELTELHGGVVTASSPGPNLGASFTVRLPHLDGLRALDVVPAEAAEDAGTVTLAGIRVLAVDDNADALEVLASSLAHRGADVRVATTGEAAMREWEREPADVLICDLAMPQMDGFAVLRGIQERDRSAGRHTAAIALTAHASSDYSARARDAGFHRHVAKPCDFDELALAVRSAFEQV